MKIWKIEAYIESEDNISKKDIISAIDIKLNKGEGYYFDIDKNFNLKLVKKIKEPQSV